MKIARDIMTKNPFALKSSMQVDFAVRTMIDHHISTAPVLDNNNQLMGQVSEITLLKAYIMASKKGVSSKLLVDFQKSFTKPTIV
jgi:CBS-domain-containing membrane protein